MEPVELAGDDLLLRTWQVQDVPALTAACQDPAIQRPAQLPVPYTTEHAHAFVTGKAPQVWREGTGARFGVFDPGTGELLGAVTLFGLNLTAGTAEIGYWSAPWARGRGIAERATRLAARWALEELGLARLVWQAEVGHHASRLIAQRLGFQLEGTLRAALSGTAPGERRDGWLASLLPGELREADDRDDPQLVLAARQARAFGAPQPTLGTGPVRLRPLTEADLPEMLRACQDPDMVRYTTVPNPYRPADAEFYLRLSHSAWLAGETGIFAVSDPDGRYLGTFDLRLDEWPARIGSLGFAVAPWARGRGIGTAALRLLCDWGFDALGLSRIDWRAFVGNRASRRIVEKVGFTVEGTERQMLVQRGTPRDSWYGALLATDRDGAGQVTELDSAARV